MKTRVVRDWGHHINFEFTGMTVVSHVSQEISMLSFSGAYFPKFPNFLYLLN